MGVWLGYLILGFVAGVFGASLGVGGGIVLVPSLVIAFSIPQKSAQGMSLAVLSVLTLVGALRYWANPAIKMDWSVIACLAVTAMLGAAVGAEIAKYTPAHVLKKVFATVMVIVAVRLAFFSKPPPADSAKTAAAARAGEEGRAP